MKLIFSALSKLIFGFLALALLLFLPAGTLDFRGAWLLCGILFIPMIILGIFLLVKAPKLLKKRLDVKENESAQKTVVALSALVFVGGFVTAGLDFRFKWSHVPAPVVIAAAAVFLLGYAMYAEVVRENEYLSRTVKVEKEQKVISTGLYAIVRHPMYLATLFMFLAMPIVLGSWYSLAIFMFYPAIIVVRIKGEEKLLEKELGGYIEYKQKVKYKLIPFVW